MRDEGMYAIPVIHPFPYGENDVVISLNDDEWLLKRGALNSQDEWEKVSVPSVQWSEQEVVSYRRMLDIPSSWQGKRVFLRFDGANCYTRVYMDGQFVMDHYGGFVSWDCELQNAVPGKQHELTLEIEARTKETSPFHFGGLMREVTLFALPRPCLASLHVDTVFDSSYCHADLHLSAATEGDALVQYTLEDPDGSALQSGRINCCNGKKTEKVFKVCQPRKWDSEHPWLYTLRAVVYDADGNCVETVKKRFGFRQIERRGNEVFINGQPVKLRGVNRHDVHPQLHRAITHELVEEDVRKFKAANINFIRTSHYTPRPDLLDLCDRYGIYVEDEAAVAFLGYALPRTESDPTLERAFMQPFAEMVERDMDHPCVIIWSLANESYWGKHHARMQEYAHWRTPHHLTIFSYPMTQQEDDEPADIWSAHYDRWDYELSRMSECFRRSDSYAPSHPVLHDESTHIPCYNKGELQRDPGVSDFWGETLWRFFDRIWETKGALGCAIWCGVDDVMNDRGKQRGYPWGIIDGWRREKPEYWHVRKGYSPLKMVGVPMKKENMLLVRMLNRFNHTNLQELNVCWACGDREGTAAFESTEPGKEGVVKLPLVSEEMLVRFVDPFGWQVDEISIGQQREAEQPELCGVPDCRETDDAVIFSGEGFELAFSRETGLILYGMAGETKVLSGGPNLHLTGLPLAPWQMKAMCVHQREDCLHLEVKGSYGRVKVRFDICVDRAGLMRTECTITDMPYASPRRIAITSSLTAHSGGYHEVGLSFRVPSDLSELKWLRKGLWSVYPDWHIGRNEGCAMREGSHGYTENGRAPEGQWKDDERDWVVHGSMDIGMRGSRDFAASRENVLGASLACSEASVHYLGDGSAAIRMEVQPRVEDVILPDDYRLKYTGQWEKLDNGWRTPAGYEMIAREQGASCECSFEGTGIAWLSSQDFTGGLADVWLDGEKVAEKIDLGLSAMGKNPRGRVRQYGRLMWAVENLPAGSHRLVVVVRGEKARDSHNAFVPVDRFLVLGHGVGETKFIIDKEINFPELSWACYNKPPVLVETGYSMSAWIQMRSRR